MFDFLGRPRGAAALASVSAIAIVAAIAPAHAQEAQRAFDIPAQSLQTALTEFSRQSDTRVMADPAVVNGRQAPALQGSFSVNDALNRLLAGSGLTFSTTPSGTIMVQDPASPTQLGDARGAAPSDDTGSDILVVGRRTLNTDIRRTEDDAQPYVVIDQEAIENSMATDVEGLLRSQLPMAPAPLMTNRQGAISGGLYGNTSSVDLRGLGSGQTLVLVDGRRLPSLTDGISFRQPDLNGIPLSSIERIEVLPSTASGVYGGGATGGVVNIILKRDYQGGEATLTYGDTFDGVLPSYRAEINGGWALPNGRTHIMATASYSDTPTLIRADRENMLAARRRQLEIDPSYFDPTATFFPVIGATTNFCAASSGFFCDGAPLVLDNGTPLNASYGYVPEGYEGYLIAGDDGLAFLGTAGAQNLGIANDASTPGLRETLINSSELSAFAFNIRHEFNETLTAYLDFLHSSDRSTASVSNTRLSSARLAADAPTNPFTTDLLYVLPSPNVVRHAETEVESSRALGGVIVRLPARWSTALDYSLSKSSITYRTPSVGPLTDAGYVALSDGTLDPLRDVNAAPLDFSPYLQPAISDHLGPRVTSLRSFSARASGPVIDLPAGSIWLTGSLEQKVETVEQAYADMLGSDGARAFQFYPQREQVVDSIYAEARIPIVSPGMNVPFVHNFELTLAARRDEYESEGSLAAGTAVPDRQTVPDYDIVTNAFESDDYTIAASYNPIQDITLRASAGTGFLPPNIDQIGSVTLPDSGIYVSDPQRGGAFTVYPNVDVTYGGEPDLLPEESENFSAGLIWTPESFPGFRLSVDYTTIEKFNEITFPDPQFIFDNEGAFPSRITRAPLTPAEEALGFTAGEVLAFDNTLLNLLNSSGKYYDIQLGYETDVFGGRLRTNLTASYVAGRAQQFAAGVAQTEFEKTLGQWSANNLVSFERGPWEIGWNTQYFDERCLMADCSFVPTYGTGELPPLFLHDAFFRFRFEEQDAELFLGIQNVFDETGDLLPASLAFGTGFDPRVDVRLRRFTVSLRASF